MATYFNAQENPSVRKVLLFYRRRPVVRLYVTLALTLFTIAIFSLFAIRPTLITVSGLVKEMETKRQTVSQLDQKITSVIAAQNSFAEVSSNLGLLDQALPLSPKLAVLGQQINALAAQRQVKLRSLSFDQFNLLGGPATSNAGSKTANTNLPGTSVPLISYPFTLTAVGPYSSLYGFAQDVAQLRRLISLTGVSLNQSTTDTGVVVTLTMSGSVMATTP